MPQPPSGLDAALRQDADKQAWVDWLFSRVADRYDLGNDIMSAGWHTRWKKRLVDLADIRPDHQVLDLACGTGDVTYLCGARAHRGQVVGVDINPDMLARAEPKRPEGMTQVRFQCADGGSLPFPDQTFDRITCVRIVRGKNSCV